MSGITRCGFAVTFWYLLAAAQGAHPEHEQTRGQGAGASASHIPSVPSWCGNRRAPGSVPTSRRTRPTGIPHGPGDAGTRSCGPGGCQGHGEQKRRKSKGEKNRAIFRGRICPPVPIKLKREAKTKAAGIALQRNGL